MGVPPSKHRGVGSEAYLNGTSEGPTPEDARLPARRAYSSERRTAGSVVAASDSWNILVRLACKRGRFGDGGASLELRKAGTAKGKESGTMPLKPARHPLGQETLLTLLEEVIVGHPGNEVPYHLRR
jgi:hypothetical protein